MIAVATVLVLIGFLDALTVILGTQRRSQSFAQLRWIIFAVVTTGFLVPVVISSGWDSGAVAICAVGIWALTYHPKASAGWQLLALGGVITAIICLLAPVLLLKLPGYWGIEWGSASFGWDSLDIFPGWAVYLWVVLAIGVLLVNAVTANRIVRIILDLVNGGPSQGPDATPAAGRFIGVLERILLVILLLAGQGVSIAGIAAAKGIIRYPEISKTVRDGNTSGLSAEIFFIGTVTSWLVALATVGIIAVAQIR